MNLRTFHKIDGAETGLDVFNNWAGHATQPIKDTDLSLIFNGERYVDNSADYIAMGKVVIPCLTTDNLTLVCAKLSGTELSSIKKSLGVPDKSVFVEWLKSEDGVRTLEELGFVRKN